MKISVRDLPTPIGITDLERQRAIVSAWGIVSRRELDEGACRTMFALGEWIEAPYGRVAQGPLLAVPLKDDYLILGGGDTRLLATVLAPYRVVPGRVRRAAPDDRDAFEECIVAQGGRILALESWTGLTRELPLERCLETWEVEARQAIPGPPAMYWQEPEAYLATEKGMRWRKSLLPQPEMMTLWRSRLPGGRYLYALGDGERHVLVPWNTAQRLRYALDQRHGTSSTWQVVVSEETIQIHASQAVPYAEYRMLIALGERSSDTNGRPLWTFPTSDWPLISEQLSTSLGISFTNQPQESP